MSFLAWVLVIIAFFVLKSYLSERSRREKIYRIHGRTEAAEKIINRILWVGETTDQLQDSLGRPQDIDESVLKTKTKETWKYHRKSAQRYGLKVKVEDGIVVGWDEKL